LFHLKNNGLSHNPITILMLDTVPRPSSGVLLNWDRKRNF